MHRSLVPIALLLFVLCIFTATIVYGAKDKVTIFTDDNFDEIFDVSLDSFRWLVYCDEDVSACKKPVKEWHHLVDAPEWRSTLAMENIRLARIDCGENPDPCYDHHIKKQYPTIKLWKDVSKSIAYPSKLLQDSKSWLNWLENELHGLVVPIKTSHQFEETVLNDNANDWLVEFYSSSSYICPRCEQLAIELKNLSQSFKDENSNVRIAKILCDEYDEDDEETSNEKQTTRALCDAHLETAIELPTIKFISKGEVVAEANRKQSKNADRLRRFVDKLQNKSGQEEEREEAEEDDEAEDAQDFQRELGFEDLDEDWLSRFQPSVQHDEL